MSCPVHLWHVMMVWLLWWRFPLDGGGVPKVGHLLDVGVLDPRWDALAVG